MMTNLSNVEARLPPGFRFHPRDDELVCDYLVKWMSGFPHSFPSLIEVDLNKCEPWDIPETACVGGKEWYFYSLRDRKYATGLRTNRATVSGYWKATGKDRPITRKGALVGMRKTLVFYQGRAPKGRKTDWVMHEFRIQGSFGPSTTKIIPPAKGDWVLCRVFFKSRSDNSGKQEAAEDATASSPSPSFPGLMEPSPYITFEQTQEEAYASDHNNNNNRYHHEQQVPCFSILSPNIPHHMDPPPPHMLPKTSLPNNFGSEKPSNLGFYDSSSAYYDHKSTMRAFLSHLTKIENDQHPPNNVMMLLKGSSPSLGEGSSDCSYLSDVAAADLSSLWNQYA